MSREERSREGLKLKVRMKILEKVEEVLIDTGAEVNVITKHKAREMNLNIDESESEVISLPGTNTIQTKGITNISMKNKEYRFLVCDKLTRDTDLIIGWTTLKQLGISIKAKDNEVIVKVAGEQVEVKEVEVNRRDEELRVKKEIVIKARSQKFVRVKDDGRVVFANPSLVVQDTPLRIGRGNITTHLLVSNWGNEDIILKKGALLAYGNSNEYEIYNLDEFNDDIMYAPLEKDKYGCNREEIEEEIERLSIGNNLNIKDGKKLRELIVKWRSLFASDPSKPGLTTKTKLKIIFKDNNIIPIRERPRRVPVKGLEEMRRQVKSMLDGGIITRTDAGSWSFPVVLSIKADGSWRFCVDYSKLNDKVVQDSYPLPNIEEYIDILQGAKIMSVVDLASGFWQVPVDEDDREKLSFVTTFGTYKFNVMPFGFVNSPAIFQAAIAETLDPVLYKCALVYVDDVIIYSNDLESHFRDIDNTFRLLHKYNWKIKLKKCRFAENEVDYLGYRIGNGSIKPIERNLDKLRNMKMPETAVEMESFIGMIGYYKKFVKGYDYVINPLRKYTYGARGVDKNKKFNLRDDEEAMRAYNVIINLLVSAPILHIYDKSKDIIVKTDCSGFAWGAVLCQVYDGVEMPVAYASGTLNSSQRNWPTWKREMYGSLKAIEKWRPYLLGNTFTLVTDHKANIYLMDPLQDHSNMINNWKMILSQYRYKVVHRPGKYLVLEDALSRSPELLCLELDRLILNQDHDKELSELKKILLEEKYVSTLDLTNYPVKDMVIIDNVLYYISYNNMNKRRRFYRIVLTDSGLDEVFTNLHSSNLAGHLGFARTYENIAREYWSYNLYSKVKERYEKCRECKMNQLTRRTDVDDLRIIANEPFEILEMDHIVVGVEGEGGYNYILTVTDVFSGKTWFLPSKTMEALETYRLLFDNVFSVFRFPKYLYSDNSSSFNNEIDNLISAATGMKHEYARTNSIGHTGSVENRNKVVELIITKFLERDDQSKWPRYCSSAAYAYNKSINSLGFAPDTIVLGFDNFSLIDLETDYDRRANKGLLSEERVKEWIEGLKRGIRTVKEVRNKLSKNKDKDKFKNTKKNIKVGDYVVLSQHEVSFVDKALNRKLANRNIGPYKVLGFDDQNHAELEITPTKKYKARLSDIILFKENYVKPSDEFYSDMNEIILEKLKVPRKYEREEKVLGSKFKKELDIKSIVGRRISVYESKWKKWYKGRVIGYNNSRTMSLVQYDDATIGDDGEEVDVREDFYKMRLVSGSEKEGRVEKWSLLCDV
jgi:predicted aspartyl protease